MYEMYLSRAYALARAASPATATELPSYPKASVE